MVKRGGTKTKIPMEKITKKLSIAPTYTKRREGLFSKASQLCLLSGAQIAVLATPLSSESNDSFYSFGHSSVDDVVSAYLSGQRPLPVLQGNNKRTREDVGVCLTRKNLGLRNWWEDESLNRSENPEELRHAMDSMWTLLSDLKGLKTNVVVNNDRREEIRTHQQAFVYDDDQDLKKIDVVVLDNGTPDQTLILQSTTFPEICCIPDDDDDSPKNYTLPQGNNNAGLLPEEGYFDYGQDDIDIENLINFDYIFEDSTHLEDVATNLQSTTSPCIPDDDDDDYTEEQYQINEICGSFAVSDNNITLPQGNNNAEDQHWDYIQEMDFEQLLDFDYIFEDTTHLDLEEVNATNLSSNSELLDADHVSMQTTTDTMMCSSYLEGLEAEDDLQFPQIFPTYQPFHHFEYDLCNFST